MKPRIVRDPHGGWYSPKAATPAEEAAGIVTEIFWTVTLGEVVMCDEDGKRQLSPFPGKITAERAALWADLLRRPMVMCGAMPLSPLAEDAGMVQREPTAAIHDAMGFEGPTRENNGAGEAGGLLCLDRFPLDPRVNTESRRDPLAKTREVL